MIAKLLKGYGMNDVFDFFEKTGAEALANGAELLVKEEREKLKGGSE